MNFSLAEYDEFVGETSRYNGPGEISGLTYAVLAMVGEAGELANKLKKVLRDSNGVVSAEIRADLLLESGDVAWYLAAIARELDSDLQTVIDQNVTKLTVRRARGTLQGSGDHR